MVEYETVLPEWCLNDCVKPVREAHSIVAACDLLLSSSSVVLHVTMLADGMCEVVPQSPYALLLKVPSDRQALRHAPLLLIRYKSAMSG